MSRFAHDPFTLGAAVRDARVSAGRTQAEVAQAAHCSRQWLVGFERGDRSRAEADVVFRVLHALGLHVRLEAIPEPGDEELLPL
ncbi:helix-turn-helix domain-containing protein [Xylanimonas allomyrinae]|nr:helix-turn-helix transcriptional regulator [Xylanimonas allomyrinae]